MKIGIATFHQASNYGAVLQAFALQTFLRNMGHEPFFINHSFGSLPQGIRRYIGKTPAATMKSWTRVRRSAVFHSFSVSYLGSAAAQPSTDHDFISHLPEADAYICGSDQVWNPSYLRRQEHEILFFLGFGPKTVRRIAYAASIGVEAIPYNWKSRFIEHLRRFDYISVREQQAMTILKTLIGKPVAWVPDPTFLLNGEDYLKVFRLFQQPLKEIFSYTLDRTISPLVTQTRACIAKSLGMKLKETYHRNPWRILFCGVPSPRQWLSSLARSGFVVTNSFHGTVFAIIFKRPFIVLPVEGAISGMNTRITSLLGRCELEDRFVTEFDAEKIDALCHAPIDWKIIEEKVREFASVGELFLKTALE